VLYDLKVRGLVGTLASPTTVAGFVAPNTAAATSTMSTQQQQQQQQPAGNASI
jgi:hypothetical protein